MFPFINNLDEMLGTKEDFENANNLDEDGDDLIGEKINQDTFESMAMDAMEDLGLTEDEAERELEDFNN